MASYLRAMDVSDSYIGEMYVTPKSHVRWIRGDEFARDFAGFIPKLRRVIEAMCFADVANPRSPDVERDQSAANSSVRPDDQQRQCEHRFQARLATDARANTVRAESDTNPLLGR
jgi:hypothetical protein